LQELEVEKKSKKIVQRQKEDEALSAMEFQHSVQDDDDDNEFPILPPKDDGDEDDANALRTCGLCPTPHSHSSLMCRWLTGEHTRTQQLCRA
jgi:hypothetical protein